MDLTINEIQAQLVQQLYQSSETASLDAQVLLAHYLEKPRSWILAHPDVSINLVQYENISQAVDRLVHGEPLPYLIGHWEFFGLDFQLTQAVLIPRPETELLVEQAIDWLRNHPTRRRAIDVGTGSGCLGISLAKHITDLRLVLTDISSQAIEVAQLNAEKHGVSARLEFKQANLLNGIVGPFDLMCANLPYIPTSHLRSLPVGKSEPLTALDGGKSGTVLTGRLLEQARHQLVTGGALLLEIESTQGDEITTLAKSFYPFSKVDVLKDLSGRDRCLEVLRPNMLVHICTQKDWLHAQQIGKYHNTSLEQDGFIHCSQPEQILDVANRFYRGLSDLVLLWLDPSKLISEIRWESVDVALFPHIYGPINLDAVISASILQPEDDGVFHTIQLPG